MTNIYNDIKKIFTKDSNFKMQIDPKPIDNLSDNGFSGIAIVKKTSGEVVARKGFSGATAEQVKRFAKEWFNEKYSTRDSKMKDSGNVFRLDGFKTKSGMEYQLVVNQRENGGPGKYDSGEIIAVKDPYDEAIEIKTWRLSGDKKKDTSVVNEARSYFSSLKSKEANK